MSDIPDAISPLEGIETTLSLCFLVQPFDAISPLEGIETVDNTVYNYNYEMQLAR